MQREPAAPIRRRGRPADDGLPDRVRRAALEVYSESGWSGFTIDAVAARAAAGKASIYQRWPSKQGLLVDALVTFGPENVPTGAHDHFRDHLIEYVERLVETFSSPSGLIHLRAQLDAKTHPGELGPAMEELQRTWVHGARALVRAAIERGELPPDTSTTLLFDTVRGATINRFLSLPADRHARFRKTKSAFAAQVTDMVLRGVGAAPA